MPCTPETSGARLCDGDGNGPDDNCEVDSQYNRHCISPLVERQARAWTSVGSQTLQAARWMRLEVEFTRPKAHQKDAHQFDAEKYRPEKTIVPPIYRCHSHADLSE